MLKISVNIGADKAGILNSFPIYNEFDNIREFTDLIRSEAFQFLLWAHDNYIPNGRLSLFVYIREDDGNYWEWIFKINLRSVREYKLIMDLSREEIDLMKISQSREDLINSIL